jgi:hypothetical protein
MIPEEVARLRAAKAGDQDELYKVIKVLGRRGLAGELQERLDLNFVEGLRNVRGGTSSAHKLVLLCAGFPRLF